MEKPISLLNVGQCFQVPTHSGCREGCLAGVLHITITNTYKRHYYLIFSSKDTIKTRLVLVLILLVLLHPVFQCDAGVCMPDGILVGKAYL